MLVSTGSPLNPPTEEPSWKGRYRIARSLRVATVPEAHPRLAYPYPSVGDRKLGIAGTRGHHNNKE